MRTIHNYLTQIYHENLMHHEAAKKYLYSRGLKQTTIKKFFLGYGQNDIGYEKLKDKYSKDTLLASGLFYWTPFIFPYGDGLVHDMFHGSITIPIIYQKKVVYMTSRTFPEYNGCVKHLHQKGPIELAMNMDVLDHTKSVIIVEGPFDCLTLDQHDIPAIGLLGANRISTTIIKALKDKRVYIAFDNDPNEAGQKAAKRLAQKLNKFGILPAIITLSSDKKEKVDVNEYFQTHTKQDFTKLIKQARVYKDAPKPPKIKRNKSTYSIVEIALDYGLQVNQHLKCVCPFHDEQNPSLALYPKTGTWYCFGCAATGDGIELIKKLETQKGKTCSFTQAQEIAKKYMR